MVYALDTEYSSAALEEEVKDMLIPPHLVNERFDDRYFDVVNAIDEAQQIYFENNQLLQRLTAATAESAPLVIGETGFGAGRIVVALLEYLKRSGQKDAVIEYNSVELYPISTERMQSILSSFRDRVGEEIEALVGAYQGLDLNRPGWHTMKLQQPFGTIVLNLWLGEALEMVEALKPPCDIWFLDGHGPKKNPSIWRPELLAAIGEKTKPGGSCSTFTVAVAVQRALTAAGFTVTKLPGHGIKNEVLHGLKIV